MQWSNATVISDGYNGSYWNTGSSRFPAIAIDYNQTMHVVWYDSTACKWGTDNEIMYTTTRIPTIEDGWNGDTTNFEWFWLSIISLLIVIPILIVYKKFKKMKKKKQESSIIKTIL